jgi:threo-3-hydroxy-L-aspartate ammonia-lyase
MNEFAISYDDIVGAADRLCGKAQRTPVFTSKMANQQSGARLFFKCENFQRTGAFKFRGAFNAIAQFTPQQLATGVIAFSSGNHAQAIAFSARELRTKAVIIMPTDAPKIKIDATRSYGAEIILYDRYTENREEIGQRIAKEHGLTLIPPYDNPQVMAGQGTLVKELIEDVGELDALVVPLGGGGLLSGCAIAAKALNPFCRIFGVEPEAGNDGQRSFNSGQIVHIDPPKTIADGAQTQHLGEHTFPIIRRLVDDVLTVRDDELVGIMKFFGHNMKIIVEPTGCLAAAAVLGKKVDLFGRRVGVVVSGGNVDLTRFASLVNQVPT